MFVSQPGKALFASGMLLVQAIAAGPALATESAPLDDRVLNEVTARGLGDVLANRLDLLPVTSSTSSQIVQTATIYLSRAVASSQQSLSAFGQASAPDFPGTSQEATNLALALTLNGTTNFAYVRQ